jgi:uncharacterized membrane protein YbhN (UPF0104 family)
MWVNPGAIILAYAVANFAGLISILPAGVGIYEALMSAVLAATGIPAGVSWCQVISCIIAICTANRQPVLQPLIRVQ